MVAVCAAPEEGVEKPADEDRQHAQPEDAEPEQEERVVDHRDIICEHRLRVLDASKRQQETVARVMTQTAADRFLRR